MSEDDIRSKLEYSKKQSYNLDKTKSKLLQTLKGPNDKSLAL
jgi:hypothetical protein